MPEQQLTSQLVTIAASHDGKLIATACRASNADHAVVRIQSTETWDAVGEPLAGHSLSITRIAFSPDDKLILTCSRDRGWRLFSRKPTSAEGMSPLLLRLIANEKASNHWHEMKEHTREWFSTVVGPPMDPSSPLSQETSRSSSGNRTRTKNGPPFVPSK